MAVINDPNTAANVAKVGPVDTASGDQPLHVDVRPPGMGSLGQYIAFGETGSIAAGALTNGELFQLRYTGTNIVIVHSVMLEYVVVTTAFVAGEMSYNVIKATGWTVDGTGGALQTPEKLRTSFAAPTATFRVPTTAALGAGTKTLATNPLRKVRGQPLTGVAVAGGDPILAPGTTAGVPAGIFSGIPLYPSPAAPDQVVYPIHLVQNEGIVVRITQPGREVAIHGVTIRFSEVSAY